MNAEIKSEKKKLHIQKMRYENFIHKMKDEYEEKIMKLQTETDNGENGNPFIILILFLYSWVEILAGDSRFKIAYVNLKKEYKKLFYTYITTKAKCDRYQQCYEALQDNTLSNVVSTEHSVEDRRNVGTFGVVFIV